MNLLKRWDLKIGTRLAQKLGIKGGVGGAALHGHTLLTTRHLVPDIMGTEFLPDLNGKIIPYKEVVKDRRSVKNRVVTTAFVNYLVDNLIADTTAWGDFKFHDSGIGTNAEAIGDTALQTSPV